SFVDFSIMHIFFVSFLIRIVTVPPALYSLSLHDALPIWPRWSNLSACRRTVETIITSGRKSPSVSTWRLPPTQLACSALRQLGDHLDLELKAIQPGYAHASQRRVRCLAPVLRNDLPDGLEFGFRIDDEHGHVDHVLEAAAGFRQDRVEVVESATHLHFQVRLRRAVFATADLPRHE